MRRQEVARFILTGVLLAGAAASFVLDWSANHLLNPAWPGHATKSARRSRKLVIARDGARIS